MLSKHKRTSETGEENSVPPAKILRSFVHVQYKNKFALPSVCKNKKAISMRLRDCGK